MKKDIDLIMNKILKVKKKMKTFIENLPDNDPGITLLSHRPLCGTVNISTITKNNMILSPQYYLNTSAKEELIRIIDNIRIEQLEKTLLNIIKTKRITTGFFNSTLNPHFVENLKKIMTGK